MHNHICSRDGTFFKFYSAPWAGWVTPTTPLQSPIILFLDIHEVFFLNMAHTIMAEIISTTKLKDLNGEYLEVVHIYMGLISWSAILFITKVTFFIELVGNSRLNIIFKNCDWAKQSIFHEIIMKVIDIVLDSEVFTNLQITKKKIIISTLSSIFSLLFWAGLLL